MDDSCGVRSPGSMPRRWRALIVAVLVALAGAACDADKQAVPDPQKPPLPKTLHQ